MSWRLRSLLKKRENENRNPLIHSKFTYSWCQCAPTLSVWQHWGFCDHMLWTWAYLPNSLGKTRKMNQFLWYNRLWNTSRRPLRGLLKSINLLRHLNRNQLHHKILSTWDRLEIILGLPIRHEESAPSKQHIYSPQ